MILSEIDVRPTGADPILVAGRAAAEKGDYAAGLQTVLPFLAQTPINTAYLDLAVTCYWQLGDTQTALALVQTLVEAEPQNARVWGKLGGMLLSMGEKDGAAAAFEQCLSLTPRSPSALGALNLIKPFARGSHRARLLKDLAKARTTSPYDKAIAWNGCGQIEERAGQYAAAFRCFGRSNAAQPLHYDAAAFDWLVDMQERHFAPVDPPEGDVPRCVFVVGMPRSGTTLVEKILLRHPEVRSTGEGKQLQAVMAGLRRQFPDTDNPWAWTKAATPDDLQRARDAFLRRIAVPAGHARPFVVNKLPLGCFDIGAAQLLLPDARFVFMSRHPLDVGLSNFRTNFHEANPFSKSLEGIGHMTRCVYRSLDDYAGKLGERLRMQSYAALVADPEPETRALLRHLGLTWHDACLTPEEEAGAVRTASIMQVREAINTKGLDKWRRYEPQLAPLKAALGEAWLAEWAVRDQGWAG